MSHFYVIDLKMVILVYITVNFVQNCHFGNHRIQKKQFTDGDLAQQMGERFWVGKLPESRK